MKKLCFYLFGILLVMPSVWAENSEKLVTLEEASTAAGLNTGSQQRLLKQGIDLKQLALGLEDAYRARPDEKRLQSARDNMVIFPSPPGKNKSLEVQADKKKMQQASFDLGIVIAVENQEQLKTIDVAAFMAGFKTGYKQDIASPQLAAASIIVHKYMQQKRMEGADERLIKAKQFLAENANRKGVIVTASGLQYEILEQGSGDKPSWKDRVTVNYRHTKPNSDFLYDSAEHGHSETMSLRGVIPAGWLELFLLMNKGARYRVYLPPALGWGTDGNGDALLPNEVLITEFTLLDIIPPPPVNY